MDHPGYRSNFFWGVADPDALDRSISDIFGNVKIPRGHFASDNLITWGRNLGFVDDKPLIAAWRRHATLPHERGILWRTATLVWAARQALRRAGAFVECGTYLGTTAHILQDAVGLDRPFHLYDTFESAEKVLPKHSATLFDQVTARFAPYPNVVVTQGSVPESLSNAPEQIAFLHIDMNSRVAEIGALEALFARMAPGGVLVLDDYGWRAYGEQFAAERDWFAARGVPILELPTGQGLVIA